MQVVRQPAVSSKEKPGYVLHTYVSIKLTQ